MITAIRAITGVLRRIRSALRPLPPDPVLRAAIESEDAAIWHARTILRGNRS